MFHYFRKHRDPNSKTSVRQKRKSSPKYRDFNSLLKFETLEPRWVLDSVTGLDNSLYFASLVSDPTSGVVTDATVSKGTFLISAIFSAT